MNYIRNALFFVLLGNIFTAQEMRGCVTDGIPHSIPTLFINAIQYDDITTFEQLFEQVDIALQQRGWQVALGHGSPYVVNYYLRTQPFAQPLSISPDRIDKWLHERPEYVARMVVLETIILTDAQEQYLVQRLEEIERHLRTLRIINSDCGLGG